MAVVERQAETPKVRAVTVYDQTRDFLEQRMNEFKIALPTHIPAERFVRTALTAINATPNILKEFDQPSMRMSLGLACLKAAQDGLIFDGREAALVMFRTKEGPKVQYMPMVYGLMKKARNSGEISSIEAHVICAGDEFTYELGDNERLIHKPNLKIRGEAIGVYSVAKLKDGTIQREVMSRQEVEAVRKRSRAANDGPWVTDWNEMARKTVIRRLSKYLPASTDKETGQNFADIVSRDDDLYDKGPLIEHEAVPPAPKRADFVERIEAVQVIAPEPSDDGMVDLDGEYRQVMTGRLPDTPEERGEEPTPVTPSPTQWSDWAMKAAEKVKKIKDPVQLQEWLEATEHERAQLKDALPSWHGRLLERIVERERELG